MAMTQGLCAGLIALLCCGTVLAPEATAQDAASVVARLAAAKLAESKGEFASAEQELRSALAHAKATKDPRETQAYALLAKFLREQGRSAEAAAMFGGPKSPPQDSPSGDPIQRLIRILDGSASTTETAKSAKGQLKTLGTLVLPQLLAAFPKLGPFGKDNVLDLIYSIDDPRTVEMLQQQLTADAPAVIGAIAQRMFRMPETVAVPLAEQIATLDVDAQYLGTALDRLLRNRPNAESTRQLATRMAASSDEKAHRVLLDKIGESDRPWVSDILAALREKGAESTRVEATFRWIRSQKDMSEDAALAAIKKLDPARAAGWISNLGDERPSWVRVGLHGLRAVKGDAKWEESLYTYVEKFAWHREADLAAPELLSLPAERNQSLRIAVLKQLDLMAVTGWRLPESFDSRFAEILESGGGNQGWPYFVAALPADAEARAIAIWQARKRSRAGLVAAAVEAERPWHLLAAKHLLSRETWSEVHSSVLLRDWSGASDEAIATFVQFAERWGRPPVGRRSRWESDLVAAYRHNANLPAGVILPLVSGGDSGAWQALVERDPRTAIDYAARTEGFPRQLHEGVVALLDQHGTAADLPLALRLVREHSFSTKRAAALQIRRFFSRHVPGSLVVLRLAQDLDMIDAAAQQTCRSVAAQAASSVRVEDFEEALAILPTVPYLRSYLLPALQAHVAPLHADALKQAVLASLEREPGSFQVDENGNATTNYEQAWLVQMLAKTGDAGAVSVLQRVIAAESLPKPVTTAAVAALLEMATDDRAGLITAMLASKRATVVQAALAAPELATDLALRERAMTTVLAMGEQIGDAYALFNLLPPADRVAFANRILGHDDVAKMKTSLVNSALDQLSENRSEARVPELANTTKHPNGWVRQHAAHALGQTFSRDAVAPLLELLKDEEATVREAAQVALNKIANYLDERAKWEKRFKSK